ncbi:hypothetical protein GCM10029992_45830 [Glycomyces albus]
MRYLLGDYTTEGGPGLAVAGPDGLGGAAAVANPSWVATGGPGGTVYTVAETESGSAAAWRIGPDFVPVPVGLPRSVGGEAPATPRSTLGEVAAGGQLRERLDRGPPDRRRRRPGRGDRRVRTGRLRARPGPPGGPHAHQIVCHAGRVLVVDLGSDRIGAFDLDGDGRLQPVAATAFEPGFGPRHLVFQGERALIAGELANAVQAASFDPASAQFHLGPVLPLPGTDPADLAALPDIGLPEDTPGPSRRRSSPTSGAA